MKNVTICHIHIFILFLQYVTVECVWLIAGLQPHLAWVRLIGLWGWLGLHTCGAWATMAPRMNQLSPHTLRREPLSWQHVPSARRIPWCHLQKLHLQINIDPCLVSEGPRKKNTKVACGRVCHSGVVVGVVFLFSVTDYLMFLWYKIVVGESAACTQYYINLALYIHIHTHTHTHLLSCTQSHTQTHPHTHSISLTTLKTSLQGPVGQSVCHLGLQNIPEVFCDTPPPPPPPLKKNKKQACTELKYTRGRRNKQGCHSLPAVIITCCSGA